MARRILTSGVDGGSTANTGYDLTQPWSYFLHGDNVAGSGVVDKARGHLAVAESSPAAMTVDVKRGAVLLKDNNPVPFLKRVYVGVIESDADGVGLTVTANASGLNRLDAVVAYADLSATSSIRGENHVVVAVVVGSGATALTDGALQTAVDTLVVGYSDVPFLRLANITVADGATSIVSANIADTRTQVRFGSLVHIDGWQREQETATRTGNHTFTLPYNATTIYGKGTRIKFVDSSGTTKYGTVISATFSAPNTTVTMATTPDYLMVAGTVASVHHSHSAPLDFPAFFSWTPVYSGSGSMTYTSVTTTLARFWMEGQMVYFQILANGTTGGVANTSIQATPPITPSSASLGQQFASFLRNGSATTDNHGGYGFVSDTQIVFRMINTPNIGLGADRLIRGAGFYWMQ